MKRLCFVIYAALLFSPFTPSQANASESTAKDAAALYQKATLLKLKAYVRTKSRELSHTESRSRKEREKGKAPA
jgi:hypothetical protein